MKKWISAILVSAIAATAIPSAALAAPEGHTVENAARRLIQSEMLFYYPPKGMQLASEDSYPATFDLRAADLDNSGEEKNYVTPVKYQAYFGSCWGFAAAAAAETSILSELRTSYEEWSTAGHADWDMDLSERHLAWFAHTPLPEGAPNGQVGEGLYSPDFEADPNSRLNIGGGAATATSLFAAGIGPKTEEDIPYRGKEGNIIYIDPETNQKYTNNHEGFEPYCYHPEDDWSLEESERFGMVLPLEESFALPPSAQFVYNGENGAYEYEYDRDGANAIKEQLMKGRPVQIGYCSNGDYLNEETWAHYTPLSYYEDPVNGETADHAVAIIGWIDGFSKDKFRTDQEAPPGDGAWIVKNSWGSAESQFPNKEDWGDKGYFYLSYYDHTIHSAEALNFAVDEIEEHSPLSSLKYDYLPVKTDTIHYYIYNEPVYMANCFSTGDHDTIVTGVTYQTSTPGSTASFQLYQLNPESASPMDGKLLASGSQVHPYGGYHRTDLDRPVLLPAHTQFSVVVQAKTADERYAVLCNANTSELSSQVYAALGLSEPYAKAVVNKGESWLGDTLGADTAKWFDWNETLAEANATSMAFFEKVGLPDLIASAQAALDQYQAALEQYQTDPSIGEEEILALEADWQEKSTALIGAYDAISLGDLDYFPGLSPEDEENFSDFALYVQDNFPISVFAKEVVPKDYELYYDNQTGRLYTTLDSETGTYSNPVTLSGARGRGNTLTLTSNFQFVTTAADGLHLPEGCTLYIPKHEYPSINSDVTNREPSAVPDGVAALTVDPGCTLNIEGALEVRAGDAVNEDSVGVRAVGDLNITGGGHLITSGGNVTCAEPAESGQSSSIGISAQGELNISNTQITAVGGEATGGGTSLALRASKLTITDGAGITARGGVSDVESVGLDICRAEDGANGIKLLNGGTLTLEGGEAERSIGLSFAAAERSGESRPLNIEMNGNCSFEITGLSQATYNAELLGVIPRSDDAAVTYDKGQGTYVGADGQPVKSLSLSPTYDFRYENGEAKITAPAGSYMMIFAAYDAGGQITDTATASVVLEERVEQTVRPENFDADGKSVKIMLWDSMGAMRPVCAAAFTK